MGGLPSPLSSWGWVLFPESSRTPIGPCVHARESRAG